MAQLSTAAIITTASSLQLDQKSNDRWTKNYCDYDQTEHGSFEYMSPGKKERRHGYLQKKPLSASMVCKIFENDDYYRAEQTRFA